MGIEGRGGVRRAAWHRSRAGGGRLSRGLGYVQHLALEEDGAISIQRLGFEGETFDQVGDTLLERQDLLFNEVDGARNW